MPAARLVFGLACLAASLALFGGLSAIFSYSHPSSAGLGMSDRGFGLGTFLSFHSPSSLFPPSAIISLTDDNSTFFLARPAAFGPVLPGNGLSGQLWVGRGFAEDGDDQDSYPGGLKPRVERELGCSDGPPVSWQPSKARKAPSAWDGTDDHLHQPVPDSDGPKSSGPGQLSQRESDPASHQPPTHADIQSLQEGAEVSGKVVLLGRGGCGFFEKVMWVQRRGGVALIVGDHTKGRGLVTMYARDDTSNVSIPSIFTSYTTAQLLSSLVPGSGHSLRASPGLANPERKLSPEEEDEEEKNGKPELDRPTFTPAADMSIAKPSSRPAGKVAQGQRHGTADGVANRSNEHVGWFRRVFSGIIHPPTSPLPPALEGDSRRPPSSGQLDWVVVRDGIGSNRPSSTGSVSTAQKTAKGHAGKSTGPSDGGTGSTAPKDDFVIGLHDWRDPDLVGHDDDLSPQPTTSRFSSSTVKAVATAASSHGGKHPPAGGNGAIITPGSGQYTDPQTKNKSGGDSQSSNTGHAVDRHQPDERDTHHSKSWLGRIPWSGTDQRRDKDGDGHQGSTDAPGRGSAPPAKQNPGKLFEGRGNLDGRHEGLWVTLTPTSTSSSPFVDTLLVLVVSPLITLTVVYALLLLRLRIRRRRWRAPKSVVERLPVRTYHTVSSASTLDGVSRQASAGATSPTTPLLHSRSIPASRPMIRSQTTSDVSDRLDMARTWPVGAHDASAMHNQPRPQGTIVDANHRYRGRQVECVVCLEEYVDGISKVMSLPCGHEFHAECM